MKEIFQRNIFVDIFTIKMSFKSVTIRLHYNPLN